MLREKDKLKNCGKREGKGEKNRMTEWKTQS